LFFTSYSKFIQPFRVYLAGAREHSTYIIKPCQGMNLRPERKLGNYTKCFHKRKAAMAKQTENGQHFYVAGASSWQKKFYIGSKRV